MESIHHIAIAVQDIPESVKFYKTNFDCEILYEDLTWALIEFSNIKLALVIPEQHQPHICFEKSDAEKYGELKLHRDGTKSCYIKDNSGNTLEILKAT